MGSHGGARQVLGKTVVKDYTSSHNRQLNKNELTRVNNRKHIADVSLIVSYYSLAIEQSAAVGRSISSFTNLCPSCMTGTIAEPTC